MRGLVGIDKAYSINNPNDEPSSGYFSAHIEAETAALEAAGGALDGEPQQNAFLETLAGQIQCQMANDEFTGLVRENLWAGKKDAAVKLAMEIYQACPPDLFKQDKRALAILQMLGPPQFHLKESERIPFDGNPCDRFKNPYFNLYDDNMIFKCERGLFKFQNKLEEAGYYKARHEAGRRLLENPAETDFTAIRKTLESITNRLRSYSQKIERECAESGHEMSISCGYAYGLQQYVDFFGPLAAFERREDSLPGKIRLKPLDSGKLAANLKPDDSMREVIFDTGAVGSVFTNDFYEKHKNRFIRVYNVVGQFGGILSSDTDDIHLFDLGEVQFTPKAALIGMIDWLTVEYETGYDHVATLGSDFFLRRPVEINHDNATLTTNPDIKNRLREEKWFGLPFYPLSNIGGIAMMAGVAVAGKEKKSGTFLRLLFDTGAERTTFVAQCAEYLPPVHEDSNIMVANIHGIHKEKLISDVGIQLGGDLSFVLHNAKMSPADNQQSMQIYESGMCGLLGSDILKLYNYIIDPDTLTIYMSPRRQLSRAQTKKGERE